jgi:hypothetical protein
MKEVTSKQADTLTDRRASEEQGHRPCWHAGWLTGWLAGWLVGWTSGWLTGWWAGWLPGYYIDRAIT